MMLEEESNSVIDNNETVEEKPSTDDYVMKLPESEKLEQKPMEPNKAAHWSMRIAGGIIDICLIFMATFGLYKLFTMSALGNGIRDNIHEMQRIADTFKLEELLPDSPETMGYKLRDSDQHYNDEKYQNYIVYSDAEGNFKVVDYDNPSQALIKKYNETVSSNSGYKSYSFNLRLYDYGIMCFAGAISEAVFIIGVPLLNKRRATIGRLSAGMQAINSKYQVEARWYQLVGRFFWIYLIESALPLLFLTNVLLITLAIQPIMFLISLFNKDKRFIHDYVSRIKIIDKRSFVRLEDQ